MVTPPFDKPEETTQETTPAPLSLETEIQSRDRKIKAAQAWLHEVMNDGQPRLASEMEALAEQEGIPKATLTLARQRCHIKSERIQNRWVWTPPRSWKQTATKVARNT